MKFNPYILFIEQWLANPSWLSEEQVEKNASDADAAYIYDTCDAADAAAAAAAAYAADDYAVDAKGWCLKYYERANENRQDYIDKVNELQEIEVADYAKELAIADAVKRGVNGSWSDNLEMSEKLIIICIKTHGKFIAGSYYFGGLNCHKEYFTCICSEQEYGAAKVKCDANIESLITDEENNCLMSGFVDGDGINEMQVELEENDKPIYTKAMIENSELPPVGSVVTLVTNIYLTTSTKIIEVVAYDKCNQMMATDVDGSFILVNLSDSRKSFQAIDNRTDEEKLIDAVVKVICASDHVEYDSISASEQCDYIEAAEDLLKSDKFEIKLKGDV